MSFYGNCPQCGTQIPQERYISGSPICACGWCDQAPAQRRDLDIEKKTIYGMIAGALAMMAFYVHMVNWGSYAFKIPFVKVAQVTGMLSIEGHRELAQACITLNKWSCARNAYLDIYRSKRDVQGLADLAHLEVRLGESQAAVAAYAAYFQAGGKNGIAALEYGKVLETTGQVDQAVQYYETSIQDRPEKLPIQATAGIVRILMKKGDYEKAYQRIIAFHNSSENAKGFLNTELAQLEKQLGSQASARLKKAAQG